MSFTTSTVAAVQAKLAVLPASTVAQLIAAVDVIGGTLVNSSGVITIGGRALTNFQYEQLFELIN